MGDLWGLRSVADELKPSAFAVGRQSRCIRVLPKQRWNVFNDSDILRGRVDSGVRVRVDVKYSGKPGILYNL